MLLKKSVFVLTVQVSLLYSLSLGATIADPNAASKPEKPNNELAISAPDKPLPTSSNADVGKKLAPPKKETHKKASAAWIYSPVAVSAIIAALITTIANLWYFRKLLRQKETEQEIARLQNLLDTFYGPMLTLKKASKNLHDLLKTKTLSSGETVKEDWRTLTKLLQENEFSPNDRTLIGLILDINKEIDTLIGKHSGLIESQILQEKLQSLRTHYRLIEAAHEKKIIGEEKRFERFVYPTGLDEKLKEETQWLKGALDDLRKYGKKRCRNIRQSDE